MTLSTDIKSNLKLMNKEIRADESFDLVCRRIIINGRESALYFVDGLVKDDIMEKILEFFYSVTDEKFFKDVNAFSENCIPYVEVSTENQTDKIITAVLSGITALFIDGFEDAVLMDLRTYPQRENAEPEKDKMLRGSRDSFVEIVVFNTALIRRRIRDPRLTMKYISVGNISKTDVVVCYMDGKADMKFVKKLCRQIEEAKVETLAMTQEALVEAIYKHPWYNPFPKVKYSERPDTAAASITEGNVVVLIDNAPSALILPTSIFDIIEEPDDFYFPPVTGTYLRITRYLVSFLTMILTPLWLLGLQNPDYVPEFLKFTVQMDEVGNIPIFWQLIVLEIAIDGLRLASLNTPNALSTSLSVIAAIALSEFAVDVGWFTSEAMLYMAFVAMANYTQPNYELGYCLKFTRVLLLILTALFNLWGFIAGMVLFITALATNRTISGKSYLYPLIPFNGKALKNKIFRTRMNSTSSK